jgi:hypothetical protein
MEFFSRAAKAPSTWHKETRPSDPIPDVTRIKPLKPRRLTRTISRSSGSGFDCKSGSTTTVAGGTAGGSEVTTIPLRISVDLGSSQEISRRPPSTRRNGTLQLSSTYQYSIDTQKRAPIASPAPRRGKRRDLHLTCVSLLGAAIASASAGLLQCR